MSLTRLEIVNRLRDLAGKVNDGFYGTEGEFDSDALSEDMHELMDDLPE